MVWIDEEDRCLCACWTTVALSDAKADWKNRCTMRKDTISVSCTWFFRIALSWFCASVDDAPPIPNSANWRFVCPPAASSHMASFTNIKSNIRGYLVFFRKPINKDFWVVKVVKWVMSTCFFLVLVFGNVPVGFWSWWHNQNQKPAFSFDVPLVNRG